LAILAGFAAAALVPSAASASGTNAGTEVVKSGSVTATLSWDASEEHDNPQNTRLTISRAGTVAFDRAIPRVCGDGCDPDIPDADNVQLVDFDGDGDPEVVLTVFPGDQCCDETLAIYGFDPASGSYSELAKDIGDTLLEIEDTDDNGTIEIVGSDQRFKSLFGGESSYEFPPVVYAYEHPATGPRLVDRTRSSLGVVREAASELKVLISSHKGAAVSAKQYVGSYVAEEFMLGHGKVGMREFDRQAKRGTLGKPATAKKFRKRLLRVLHQYGYR